MTGKLSLSRGGLAAAAGLAILLAAACSDSGRHDRGPTRPFFSYAGGGSGVTADVQVELSERINGVTGWYSLVDTSAVYAELVDGWAFADTQVGVPSALGVTPDGYPWYGEGRSGADTTTDSLNNVHVVTYYAASGTPPSHIQHFVNGQLTNDQTILWVAQDDGWVMSESVWEYYEDGDTLTFWSSASGEIAAAGFPAPNLLREAFLGSLRLLQPQPLEAQVTECVSEWANWVAAAAAVVVSGGLYLKQKNTLTRYAVLSAAAWATAALWDLVDCMLEADE